MEDVQNCSHVGLIILTTTSLRPHHDLIMTSSRPHHNLIMTHHSLYRSLHVFLYLMSYVCTSVASTQVTCIGDCYECAVGLCHILHAVIPFPLQTSVAELMKNLLCKNPNYIRCIKVRTSAVHYSTCCTSRSGGRWYGCRVRWGHHSVSCRQGLDELDQGRRVMYM